MKRELPENWYHRRIKRSSDAVLGASGDESALPRLIQALTHRKDRVRRAAAWSLGEIGHVDAVTDLLAALYDADWMTRHNAIVALGKIGDVQAIPRLTKFLPQATPDERCEIALVLLQMNGELSQTLLETLLSDASQTHLPKFEQQTVCEVIAAMVS